MNEIYQLQENSLKHYEAVSKVMKYKLPSKERQERIQKHLEDEFYKNKLSLEEKGNQEARKHIVGRIQ